MMKEGLFDQLQLAVKEGNLSLAIEVSRAIVDQGVDIKTAIRRATEAIRKVGEDFGNGEIYLPELTSSADAMSGCMKILTSHLSTDEEIAIPGSVVLATAKGDIHEIGKNIVATMLRISNLKVIDLGVNVSPMTIIDEAESSESQIIGVSSLMSTSLPYQKEVIDLLKEMELRENHYVIVGGGPTTHEYAESIGADGWAKDAAGAVRVCEKLLSQPGRPSKVGLITGED